MIYGTEDILDMLKVYHEVESQAKEFMYLASFPAKNKEPLIKSAEKVINAIENYKKLPLEIRNKLESDKRAYVHNVFELEKACKEAIKKNN